jgi:hypothetical protein
MSEFSDQDLGELCENVSSDMEFPIYGESSVQFEEERVLVTIVKDEHKLFLAGEPKKIDCLNGCMVEVSVVGCEGTFYLNAYNKCLFHRTFFTVTGACLHVWLGEVLENEQICEDK